MKLAHLCICGVSLVFCRSIAYINFSYRLLPAESGAKLVVATVQVLEVQASAQVERHLLAKLGHLGNVEGTVVVELVSHRVLAASGGGSKAQFGLSASTHLHAIAAEGLVLWELDKHGSIANAWVHNVVSLPRNLSVADGSVDGERDWRELAVGSVKSAGNTNDVALEAGVYGGVKLDFWGGADVSLDVHVGLIVAVVEVDVTQVQTAGSVEAAVVSGGEAWHLLDVEVNALADGVFVIVSDVQVVAVGVKAPLDLFSANGIASVNLKVGTAGHLTFVGIADRALVVVVVEEAVAVSAEIVEGWWRHTNFV